jgi:hypothetical protein
MLASRKARSVVSVNSVERGETNPDLSRGPTSRRAIRHSVLVAALLREEFRLGDRRTGRSTGQTRTSCASPGRIRATCRRWWNMARSIGGGRTAHGKENPRSRYAAGLWARPTPLVRGSSRRITIMRFRPANIRVINRRDSRVGHLRCCAPWNSDRGIRPAARAPLLGACSPAWTRGELRGKDRNTTS